jgi:alkylation response protein AidB-like acyl-CoA dehydrogenase
VTGLSFDVLRAMTTKASPADGGYILRGTKIWSTTAHVADRIMVTARTREDPKPSRGLTIFLVDRASPGLTATPVPKIGMRSLGSCEVVFDDVFVPEEDVLGEVGEGWRQVTSSLNADTRTPGSCWSARTGRRSWPPRSRPWPPSAARRCGCRRRPACGRRPSRKPRG